MRCPQCTALLKEVNVKIQDTESPVPSYQCTNDECGYFEFEENSIQKAISEMVTSIEN